MSISRSLTKRSGSVPSVLLLLLLITRPGLADDKFAFWADFIYTVHSREKVVWTITPSIRTDEQEINGLFSGRVTTEATFRLPKRWDVRGRFGVIGRDTEAGDDYSLDQRVQILVRYPFFRFWNGDIRVRGGTFYERHFRGDSIDDFDVYRQRFEMRADDWEYAPGVWQDFFWDRARGFYRTRTRLGLQWNLQQNRQIALAYQFQYTQNRAGSWTPQHAIVFRYWFGRRLSWRGRSG